MVGYTAAFVVLEPRLGDSVMSLSIVPIVVVAWLYGLRAGVLGGVGLVALNITLMQTVGHRDGFRPAQAPRILVAVGLGLSAGWARDLSRRQHALLDENQRASEALRASKLELERIVGERTAELVQANRDLTAELAARSVLQARAASADRMAQIGTLTAGIGHQMMVFMSGGAFTSHAIAVLDAPGRKRMDKPFTRKDLEAAIALAQGEATTEPRIAG